MTASTERQTHRWRREATHTVGGATLNPKQPSTDTNLDGGCTAAPLMTAATLQGGDVIQK